MKNSPEGIVLTPGESEADGPCGVTRNDSTEYFDFGRFDNSRIGAVIFGRGVDVIAST
ncbi:hypothetical protein HY522_01425 [bacterium]|nr:hypothetical protein [bacterium]